MRKHEEFQPVFWMHTKSSTTSNAMHRVLLHLCNSLRPRWVSINSSKPRDPNSANRSPSGLRKTVQDGVPGCVSLTQIVVCATSTASYHILLLIGRGVPIGQKLRDSSMRAFYLHVGAVFATEFQHDAVISSIGRSPPEAQSCRISLHTCKRDEVCGCSKSLVLARSVCFIPRAIAYADADCQVGVAIGAHAER